MSSDLFGSDDAELPSPRQAGKKPERELTGWMVFSIIVSFFAVIIGVNAFMAHEALSTFRGVDTDSAYRAGQIFEHEVAMAKAQDAQHWQVEAKVTPAPGGSAALDIAVSDAAGAPLAGLTATAVFARPTDRGLDRSMAVSEDAPGHFHGSADISAGQWDLIIELSRQEQRMFRSKNRVVIR
ncbi:MAG: FixH family protein [Xanthobacteraceae bacterium]|nr:FixH family protein [Xanthobacteraceae bacterium]